jgi:tRNA1(Val) A37 N6-methylase TrmN6
MSAAGADGVTHAGLAEPDVFLDGRLRLFQPERGHKAGTDAILLIAAAGQGDCVVDLGSGGGVVGLGLLALGRARRVLLVERDAEAASFARRNVALNGFDAEAAIVEADIAASAAALAAAGLAPGVADLVVSNPPYNEPGRHRTSPDPARAAAHAMIPDAMARWLKAATRALGGDGRIAMIHRPAALPWLLPMVADRFGAVSVLPVHPRASEPASRVLVGGRLNTKAPARVLPALVLHEADGAFTSEVSALQRGEAALSLW